MKYAIEFTLPGVPLAMNKVLRMHYKARNAYYIRWYQDIAAVLHGRAPKLPLERVELVFIRAAYRNLDFDGLVASMKPIADGLAHAKIIIHDGWRVTGPWVCDQVHSPKGKEYLTVLVRERGRDEE